MEIFDAGRGYLVRCYVPDGTRLEWRFVRRVALPSAAVMAFVIDTREGSRVYLTGTVVVRPEE